jgi:hypothetical protein
MIEGRKELALKVQVVDSSQPDKMFFRTAELRHIPALPASIDESRSSSLE